MPLPIADFAGTTVLVTGASRGIGRATAEAFARAGARLAVHYHARHAAAEQTLARLDGQGHFTVQADVTDPAQCRALVENVVRQTGRIDVLVNNAGVFEQHPPAASSFEQWLGAWQRTLAANLLGPAHLSYWAVQQMLAQGGGRIVNVSSRGAFRGEPEAPAYGASKAGLNAMSQSMARALAPHRIYVYVLAPGWVETDMALPHMSGPEGQAIRDQSPMHRIGTPEEMARIIVFLAAEGSEFMSGCIVDANGASYLRS